jgi:hypothetical protein
VSVGDPLCQRVAPLAVAVLLINVVLVVLTVGEVKIISSAGERGRTVPSCAVAGTGSASSAQSSTSEALLPRV